MAQAGAAAGFAVDITLFPLDTLKTRLQSKQRFIKAGGFRGIYSGIGSVAIGSAPGGMLQSHCDVSDFLQHCRRFASTTKCTFAESCFNEQLIRTFKRRKRSPVVLERLFQREKNDKFCWSSTLMLSRYGLF